MGDETLPDFLINEEILERKRKLFEARLAAGRPFPISGDVLFVRSPGKVGKANIRYQRLRRPGLPNNLFRFTHVGLVVSEGVVAHSLASMGSLEKRIEESLGSDVRAVRRTGVTLDSVSSSGFFGPKSLDALVLRNRTVFHNVELQEKLSQLAMYYFGLQYNFAIDHKKRVFPKEYEKLRLHCSDFVERVLVEARVKPADMHASEVLPVDTYRALAESDDWIDVTAEYRNEDIALGDEELAGILLRQEMVMLRLKLQSARAASEAVKVLNDLAALKKTVERHPERYASEIDDLLRGQSFGDTLKGCYRILESQPLSVTKTHVVDEAIAASSTRIHETNLSYAKGCFSSYVTSVHKWYLYALTIEEFARNEDPSHQEAVFQLLKPMAAFAKLFSITLDDGQNLMKVFARLGQMKHRKSEGSGQLAFAFSTVAAAATFIATYMNQLEPLTKDGSGYSGVCALLAQNLSKEKLLEHHGLLMQLACVDSQSIGEPQTESLTIDFSTLLRQRTE